MFEYKQGMVELSREYLMRGRNFKRKRFRKTKLLFPNKKEVKGNLGEGKLFLQAD